MNSTGQETTRRSVYEGEDLLYELDGTGTVLTEFIHGAGIDEPLAMKRDGHIYYYHADVLGSIMAITDENQNLVQRYEYDAYGNITHRETNFEQPYTYTGREFDEESGLFFYRARYYDPTVGRFISSDPIGLAGGLNRYAYVDNNPVNVTDPTGECPWCVAAGIGALTDLTVQLYSNGFNLKCVNWKEVAISGAAAR